MFNYNLYMFLYVPGSNKGVVKLLFRAKTVPRQELDQHSRAKDDSSAQQAVAWKARCADANADADSARPARLAEQLAHRTARQHERRAGN
jgi:hypothetical protein